MFEIIKLAISEKAMILGSFDSQYRRLLIPDQSTPWEPLIDDDAIELDTDMSETFNCLSKNANTD